jgi:hypothetical protein
MPESRRKKPSPSVTLSLVALIVALAGTAMAAPTAVKSVLSKPEKKQVKNIAANQVNSLAPGLSVASAQNASNAQNATNASNAQNATNATNANTASNALALGGLAASGYVRNDCSGFGQVKGFADVAGSPTFSSTFVTVFGLNCSGQTVQAKRVDPGKYEVRFNGTSATIAVATAYRDSGDPPQVFAQISVIGGGHFKVWTETSAGAIVDAPFVLVLV